MAQENQLDRAFDAARRVKELQAEADRIAEEIENLKQFVANNVPEGETLLGDEERGFIKTLVYRAKQFNEAYGKRHRPDLWDKYAEPVFTLNSTIAKKKMTEDEYAEFQKPSDKISVKLEVVND